MSRKLKIGDWVKAPGWKKGFYEQVASFDPGGNTWRNESGVGYFTQGIDWQFRDEEQAPRAVFLTREDVVKAIFDDTQPVPATCQLVVLEATRYNELIAAEKKLNKIKEGLK
jgi:hypothetical protein